MILQLRPSPKTFSHPPPFTHPLVSFLPTPRIFIEASHTRRMSLGSRLPTPFLPNSPFFPLPFLLLPIPPFPSPSLVPYPPSLTPSKRIRPSEPRCYQRRKRHPQEEACASATESPVVPSEFLALPPPEALRGCLAVPCVSMDQTLLCSSLKVPERSSLQK